MKLPLYPILLNLVLILGLYHQNRAEVLTIKDILVPLLVVVGLTVPILCVTSLVFRNWQKGALITTIITVPVFFFGLILEVTGLSSTSLYMLWAGLGLVCTLVILRTTRLRLLVSLAVLGNILLICITLVTVSSTVLLEAKSGDLLDGEHIGEIPWGEVDTRPDIYYLVFDKYPNQVVLEEYFSFDNSPFIDGLISRGFIVPDSYANYPRTKLSLASSLNMRYLDYSDLNSDGGRYPFTLIEDQVVGSLFQSGGYRFVYIGSWWPPTAVNSNADLNLVYGEYQEFSRFIYELSAIYPLVQSRSESSKEVRYRMTTLNQFDRLMEIPDIKSPTFTFAHILLPHNPFIFNPDGSPVPEGRTEEAFSEMEVYRELYTNQISFTSLMVTEVVDTILAKSDVPPIIVVQGDEGCFVFEGMDFWSGGFTYAQVSETAPRFAKWTTGILNALYLPEMPLEKRSEFGSPVNTFRRIFNYYFSADFKILPEKYYYLDRYKEPHGLVDITETVQDWLDGK